MYRLFITRAEVSLEAGNWQILPATSQFIAAYYFDKLHQFSQFSGEACPPDPLGKSCLTAPFLSQPPTSQNQLLTIKLIETPSSLESESLYSSWKIGDCNIRQK